MNVEMKVPVQVVVLLLLGAQCCLGLPVKNIGETKEKHVPREVPGMDMGAYMRYLEEIANNDPGLRERLSKVKDVDREKLRELIAKNPHMQERFIQSRENVRNQVDEAKRLTVEQMRQLQKLQSMRDNNLMRDGDWMTKKEAARDNLPAHFTDQDIQAKLKKAQQDLQELDRKRKEDFKQQEMWVEHRRRQKLAEMNEQQRLKAEQEFKQKHDDLRHHDRLPKPASKEQLEQVWEEDDGMARENFDPKTFFHMHDTNADMTLDAIELEALFYSELKKVYKDDMAGLEAHEDMARMREYAMEEIDTDHDGLISLPEFLTYTGEKLFDNKEEWHPVVDEEVPFSDKEFQDYEDEYEEDYDYQYDSEGNIIGIVPKKPPQDGVPQENKNVEGQGAEVEVDGGNAPELKQKGEAAEGEGGEARMPPQIQIDDPQSIHVEPVQVKEEQRMAPPPPSNQAPPSHSPQDEQQEV